jgi:hypothetical protein
MSLFECDVTNRTVCVPQAIVWNAVYCKHVVNAVLCGECSVF